MLDSSEKCEVTGARTLKLRSCVRGLAAPALTADSMFAYARTSLRPSQQQVSITSCYRWIQFGRCVPAQSSGLPEGAAR
jgi:hypothetical protein